jgi:hypothetical protein
MDESGYTLSVRLVDGGTPFVGAATEDCTSDTCGATPGSAGIANC